MRTQTVALIIAGCFVLMAIPISMMQIVGHIKNYTRPKLQKYILRILWMVPIYAVCSWFALCEHPAGIYLTTLRSLYEAYVIYSFFCYLVECVECNLVDQTIEELLEAKEPVAQIFPFCFLANWKMGSFLRICKGGIVLYVVAHAVTTLLAFGFAHTGVYGEGKYSPSTAYLYLSLINNFVQIWAMYCLIQFYRACTQELAPHKPVPKFLCVKAVVFFAWWQSVIITILVSAQVITRTHHLPVDNVKTGLQEFLICIEMFIAAAAHKYAFPYQEFEDGSVCQHSFWGKLFLIVDYDELKQNLSELPTDVREARPSLAPELQPLVSRVCFGPCTSERPRGESENLVKQDEDSPDALPRSTFNTSTGTKCTSSSHTPKME